MSRNRRQYSKDKIIKKQLKDKSKKAEYFYMVHDNKNDHAEKHFHHQAYGKFA